MAKVEDVILFQNVLLFDHKIVIYLPEYFAHDLFDFKNLGALVSSFRMAFIYRGSKLYEILNLMFD